MYGKLLAAFAEAVERGSRAILLRSALRHFSVDSEVNLFPERITKEGKDLMDLGKRELAPGNAALVKRAVSIIKSIGNPRRGSQHTRLSAPFIE